jgi:alcohol dehydrogenase class IV
MDMASFQHIAPPLRLFHGPESLGQLGRELDRVNSKRAVIVCGASLARQDTLLDVVRGAMGDRCAGMFTGVRAHSPVPSVAAAAAELKRLQADAVVVVGGGSAIVTARAAGILAAENRDVRKLCTTRDGQGELRSPKLLAPKLPQLVIPTTPTTAAVKAGSAVFDPREGQRLALFDPKTRAHAVFIDPRMLQSAPRALVASAGLNTFATAVEGLMSRSGNPLADALLMHAVRLLGQRLSALARYDLARHDDTRHDDATVRGELVLAAVLCGQGTDHTGAGITTVLGHAIGARHEMDNGTANAIVLPHAMRFNASAAAAGLAKIAAALGLPHNESTLSAVTTAVQTICSALGAPDRLRDVGIPAAALPAIANIAMDDWFLRGNPSPVRDAGELQEVLEMAW